MDIRDTDVRDVYPVQHDSVGHGQLAERDVAFLKDKSGHGPIGEHVPRDGGRGAEHVKKVGIIG